MSWVNVAIGVSTVGSGVLAHDAAGDAADAAARGSERGIAEQARQFDTVVGLQRPGMVTGTGALNKLARVMGLPYTEYKDPSAGAGVGGSFANPRLEKGNRLSHRNVNRLLRKGSTVEDIAQHSYLGGRLNSKRIKRLKRKGVTDEGIAQLMGGPAAARAAAAESDRADDIVTPEGPDMSEFIESPDYQYRLTEGQNAIDRSAAARSGVLNGNVIQAGIDRASNEASTEFGNFFGRLATIAGIGQQATGATTNAAVNQGNNVTQLLTNQGTARASGILGEANSVNDAIGSGLQAWLLNRGGFFEAPA